MRIPVALLAGLAAAPAMGQGYDCRMTETCNSGGSCSPASETAPLLQLVVDPATGDATLGDASRTEPMRKLSQNALGRTWLLEFEGQAIGLVTLSPDGATLVAAGIERKSDRYSSTLMSATCVPGVG